MTTFWIFALLMFALALAIVVPALWRGRKLTDIDSDSQNVAIARDRLAELEKEHREGTLSDTDFETAKLELEGVLLLDLESSETNKEKSKGPALGKQTAFSLMVLIPLFSGLLYWQLGSPQLIGAETESAARSDNPHDVPGSNLSMEDAIAQLEKRLETQSDDYQGWYTLARTYMSLDRYAEAAAAMEKAYAITGDQPAVLLALADATAMKNDGRMAGRPAELVNKALAIEPDNVTALWLAGMAAEEEGNYEQALAHWRKLLPILADEPQSLMEVQALIARLEDQLGIEPSEEAMASVANASIQVQVTLAPELMELAKPEETVFIYAKAQSGPQMPLAAVRKTVADLPLTVTLDDSMAMMPDRKLSSFDEVKIGALLSRSGVAMAKSGDLIGEVENVSVKETKNIEVTIYQRVP